MNNMPAYAIGMADHYEGPIEDPAWLGIERTRVPGNAALSQRAHRRGDERRRRRLRRGVEVRPRHHGAAALPDAALRPAGHPGQHQLPGPAADAAAARLGVRRGAAPRLRRGARAHRAGRHRRHLALAGDARLRQDQRGLGPRLPRPLGAQRPRRAARLHRRGDLPRGRPGRLRDPHLHRRRRGGARAAARSDFYAPIPIFAVGCTVATMDDR